MRSLLLSALVAVAVVASPSGARADWTCSAPIVDVLVYLDGYVNIRYLGNNWTYVCNLESTWRGVSPTTCATWVALLEKIKTKGGSTLFYFTGDPVDCSKLTPPRDDKDPTKGTLNSYNEARIPIYIGDVGP